MSNVEAEILLLAFLCWVSSPAFGTQLTSKQRPWKERWMNTRRMLPGLAFWEWDTIPVLLGQRRAWDYWGKQNTSHTSAQHARLSVPGSFFFFKFTLQLQVFVLPVGMTQGRGQMWVTLSGDAATCLDRIVSRGKTGNLRQAHLFSHFSSAWLCVFIFLC